MPCVLLARALLGNSGVSKLVTRFVIHVRMHTYIHDVLKQPTPLCGDVLGAC